MYIKNQYDKIDINDQQINIDEYETIVENINRVIEHIQNNKILATKANRYFAIKHIKEINDILVNPIEIISARPAQKTYPNVNGIYLILRTMGILRFKVSKKEIVMGIDEDILENWKKLNSTEQYFMLLEFWLVRSYPKDTIGAYDRLILRDVGDFFTINRASSLKGTIELLDYFPEYYGLALYEMFGFITIETKKPKEKNSWNVTDIKVRPLIKKLLPLISINEDETISLIFNPVKLGFFRDKVQPYFKEYKKILEYPKHKEIDGVYRLKISLGKVYRTIEIDSKKSLDYLAYTILKQFNFENDHLHVFNFTDNFGKKISIGHYELSETDFCTDEYDIKNIPLGEQENFEFIFDFGNYWKFDILIEKIDEGRSLAEVELVKSHGEAPEQYDENEW